MKPVTIDCDTRLAMLPMRNTPSSSWNRPEYSAIMVHDGSVTSPTFKEFLERLMIGATRPVFVIVDGHPIHKSRLVQDFVEGLDGQLKLFYLPPYSPHLNPDEQVWAHVKRRVSKQAVQAKDDMKKLALGALRRIQKLPRLVTSFFQQPECQYARQ